MKKVPRKPVPIAPENHEDFDPFTDVFYPGDITEFATAADYIALKGSPNADAFIARGSTYAAQVQWGSRISFFSTGTLVVTTLVALPIFVGTTVFCVSAYKEAEESTGPVASEEAATEPAKG